MILISQHVLLEVVFIKATEINNWGIPLVNFETRIFFHYLKISCQIKKLKVIIFW